MPRHCLPGLLAAVLVAFAFAGCGWQQSQPAPGAAADSKPAPAPSQLVGEAKPSAPAGPAAPQVDVSAKPIDLPALAPPDLGAQEKYDAALLDALNLLADGKLADALAALEAARALQDTDLVRLEIAKLKKRQEQQAAAERTVEDIQTVLTDGKPDEAARLAGDALQQYGGSAAAAQLARLKRQADALTAAQLTDNAARKARFRAEADAALREKNLRAAAIAFEQTLQYGDDADLRRQYDEVRAGLARYDENRQRAAELRRDPATLEDALAALTEAAKAWDTLEVRRDIDEYNLALQKRRDTLSVADFEVRGDVGIPAAGRTVAEELLPAFKARFDLVERGQLSKVIQELKLEASELAENENGRREVGRLAKVRYLVLGSVTPLSGVTVSARLVDVRTGLVVQTAKVVAPTPDAVLPLLPQLAGLLMMTDEQRMAYERQLAEQARAAPPPVVVPAPLPPPPEVVVIDQAPPPVVVWSPRPPDLGGLRAEDFDRLPPPPPPDRPPQLVVVAQAPVRQRMFQLSVEVGDNLFRRGRYREANRHFELALNLAPDNTDIRLRLDRCRPHLPPPPVVVIDAPPPPPLRPRLAVLNFAEFGDPAVLPPGLGAWTAENLAPYFCPPYEIVDRGEVFWYMGRLGMTLRDLMTDPAARQCLARALDVRFFVLGDIRPGAGLDVTAHLVDAEYGFEAGSGRVRVLDPRELKLRLCELARETLMGPEDRLRYQRDFEASQTLVVEARQRCDRGEFSVAIEFYQKALKSRPGSIEVQVLLQNCEQRSRLTALEEARRREWERQQALQAERERRQWELARAAEAARLRAEQEAALLADGERIRRAQQCERANAELSVQAQVAFQSGNFEVSISLFESALALKPSDDGHRQLALARAKAQETARARAAEAQARREADLRRQREAELAQLRAQVEDERRRHEAEEQARHKAQEDHDQAEYARLMDQGEKLLAQEQYDGAINALQAARRLRKTDEAERLVSQALVAQARAAAQKKDAGARAELERQLAAEKAHREAAEAEAKKNQELYAAALKLAQQALADKRYDDAIGKYNEAGKVFKTDVVLTGLRRAEEGKTALKAQADAEKQKQAAEQQKAADLTRLLAEGKAALDAGQPDKAIKAYTEAGKVAPGNVDALTGLSKAEQARDAAGAKARKQKEEQERQASFRTLLASGKANLQAKQYDAAVLALGEAVKLNPADADAKAALQQAEKARDAAATDAKGKAEAQKKADEYQKWMGEGRVALSAKQYDVAIKAFGEAQKLLPGDQSSAAFLKEAEKAKTDASAATAVEAKKREDEAKRAADVQKARDDAARLAAEKAKDDAQKKRDEEQRKQQVQALLAAADAAKKAGQWDAAAKALADAAKLAPQDAAVVKAQQDLDQARAEADKAKRQAALDQARAAAAAEAEKAKRQAAYQDALKAGREALKAGRYDDAGKAAAEAGRLVPGDKDAAALAKDVDSARANAKAAQDAEAKKKQEEEQRRADYTRLMTQGQQALAAKKYDDAVKAYSDALKLMPGDAEATKALNAAKQAADAAKAPPPKPPPPSPPPPSPPPPKPMPPTPPVKNDPPPKPPPPQPPAEFTRLMGQGQQAMAAKKYEDAVKAYGDALKIMPGDAEATKGLNAAKQAADAAKTLPPKPQPTPPDQPKPQPMPPAPAPAKTDPPPPDQPKPPPPKTDAPPQPMPPPKGEPAKPATPKPGGPPPPAAADAKPMPPAPANAELTKRLADGQQALNAKKYADAIREFEAALKLAPGNAEATAGLKRAREGKP